ncbi:glutathione S-transferase 1-like [Styela clava]
MVIEFYYHPLSPPSQVVWMVLKELNIPHKENLVDLLSEDNNKEAYTAINKYKVVPAIIDGDLTLSESRAIAMYLCVKYEPKDKAERLYPCSGVAEIANFNRLVFRDIDNYQTLLKYLNGDEIFVGTASGPKENLLPKAIAVLEEVEKLLSGKQYVFGNHLTLLDFFVLTTVSCMEVIDTDWKKYPAIAKWKSDLMKLPYFEECHAKGVKEFVELYKEYCAKSASNPERK